MRYRKINEATVQCIITQDDMMEYGLTLSDIFERNEKGEEFLRDVIERAYDEVGYKISSGNIAMQITPLKDEGLAVTFTDESPAVFKSILEHLKEVLAGVGTEFARQELQEAQKSVVQEEPAKEQDEDRRMFVFPSLHPAMQYAAAIPASLSVKSHLYKESGAYYLVLEKGRLSYKNFNKISAQGVEFGTLIPVTEDKMNYLGEHGECLIADRAVSRLRKIYSA